MKKELEECLKIKEERIGELEEINVQLNKNIEEKPMKFFRS